MIVPKSFTPKAIVRGNQEPTVHKCILLHLKVITTVTKVGLLKHKIAMQIYEVLEPNKAIPGEELPVMEQVQCRLSLPP